MKFIKQIERIQYLDKLIKKKSTGTPKEMAYRLGISRSQLYNLVSYLNDIGMHVKYSRSLRSFYYVEGKKNIEITFSIKLITAEETHRIHGGANKLFSSFHLNTQVLW